MADDLMKSLAELDMMLKSLPKEPAPMVDPHNNGQEEEDSPYCIKNGAYLKISEDKMNAWIYLNPPKEGEPFYSKVEIMKFMNQHGIVKGFHTSNIAAIAKKGVYEREILVARGSEPVDGVDGYFEWLVDINRKKTPTIREDGSVDYSSMSEIPSVEEGSVIAIYHKATVPKNGFDVLGGVIPAKPSKDLPALKGRGISNVSDPDVYVATMTGRVEYRDKHVDIKNCYQIKGDVDLVTGKVEFFGDVEISGNVESGVIIRASRNVIINGLVEGATIYAGGDVTIKKGIQGGQKAKITAKGNVSADFIEHCTIEAGGDVRANSFINSQINAGGFVLAEGKNGSIVAGEVRGLLGVSAMTLSNESETKTHISSGYSADEYSRYLELYQEESDAQQELSDVVDKMSQILREKRMGKDDNPEATDQLLMTLNDKKDMFFEKLDKARADKEALAAVIEKGKGSNVIVKDKVYRGVTITIEGTNFVIPELANYMKYKNEGGRIVGSVAG